MTEMNSTDINRLWFEFYIKEIGSSPEAGYKTFDNYFLCPCCYFPTLTERQGYEICLLCNWEDDGQDDHNADKVLGGPNHDYSLTEARQNFKKHLTSYRPADAYHFERTTAKKFVAGNTIYDLIELKKQIMEMFNQVLRTNDPDERKQIFAAIATLENMINS